MRHVYALHQSQDVSLLANIKFRDRLLKALHQLSLKVFLCVHHHCITPFHKIKMVSLPVPAGLSILSFAFIKDNVLMVYVSFERFLCYTPSKGSVPPPPK